MQLFILGKQVVSSVTFPYLYKAGKSTAREEKKGPGGILLKTNECVSLSLFLRCLLTLLSKTEANQANTVSQDSQHAPQKKPQQKQKCSSECLAPQWNVPCSIK